MAARSLQLGPNRDGALWRRLDPESVRNTHGGIHHLASIAQDLRAIAEDCLHLLPDRLVTLPWLARRDGPRAALIAVVVGLVWDLEEVLLFPAGVLKNGLSILAHALRAAWNALQGRTDGRAVHVAPFDLTDSDSALRLLLQHDRMLRDLAENPEPIPGLELAAHWWRERHPRPRALAPRTMRSFNGKVSWRPRLAFRPGPEIDELATILRWVRANLPPGTRLKAGGACHSVGAGSTAGVYLHPEGMRFIERLPAGEARGRSGQAPHPSLVRVGAGVTVREASERLWEWGRALPVAGGYDGQTLAGAFSTGTHGSVLRQGPMVSIVRSIDLVRVDGMPMRIEPAAGIRGVGARVEIALPSCLVRDDEVFRAALVNLGAFGVIHSYVVETVPRFHVEERTTETTLAEIRSVLRGGNVYSLVQNRGIPSWVRPADGRRFPGQPRDAYAMSLLLNPHSSRAQVCTTRQVGVQEEPCDLGVRVDRNPAKAWARDARFVRSPVASRALLAVAPRWVSRLPGLLTSLGIRDVPSVVDWSVQGTDVAVQRSYNIFHCGEGAAKVRVRFGEFFVPLRDDLYLDALHTLLEAARRWHARTGQYQTGPLSIRFIAGGDVLFGPQEDYASFECIFLGAADHMPAMMQAYKRALTERLGTSGFSMHPGMETPGWTGEEVAAQLPGYWRWREIRDAFDPAGQMLNEAQERLLPPLPPTSIRPVDGGRRSGQEPWASGASDLPPSHRGVSTPQSRSAPDRTR